MLALLAPCGAAAHVVFEAPRTYANPLQPSPLDLSPQKATYLALGEAAYSQVLVKARAMRSAVEQFLERPSAARLNAAREAWRAARLVYAETELFRFNDGPIDAPPSGDRPAGPEMRINAWPVDESTIDYVQGNPQAGLINEIETPLTLDAILARDQVGDESAVTTGWHAIEFLLWGQDQAANGPGNRSFRDYVGTGTPERRRQYLRLVTQQLVTDLSSVADQWDTATSNNYRAQLVDTAPIEVVGRALHGATSFVVIELFGERLSVALDSASQEDEHSCFSDTTHLDLQRGLAGVANLLRGEYRGRRIGAGLIEVVAFQNPRLGERLRVALAKASEAVAAIKAPFDQLILRPAAHPDRLQAEAAVAALHELALAMKASAEALGVRIVVPGV